MTLKNKLIIMLSLLAMIGSDLASAQVRPEPRPTDPPRHGGPGPRPPREPGNPRQPPTPRPEDPRQPMPRPPRPEDPRPIPRPPRPFPRPPQPLPPPRPYPPNPYPPTQPRPLPPRPVPPPAPMPGYEVLTAPLSYWVTNDIIPLRRLFNLDQRYSGYEVVSVTLQLREVEYLGDVELLVDDQVVDRSYGDRGTIVLYPGWKDVIGQEFQTMRLKINGQVYVDYVSITLRESDLSRPEQISVPVNLQGRRFYGYDQINVSNYVNLSNYNGYRLHSIELNGRALSHNVLVNLRINGFDQGITTVIDPYSRGVILYPNRGYDLIGREVNSITLMTNGDLELQSLNLRLSR